MRKVFKILLVLAMLYAVYELYSTIFNHSILALGLFAFLLFLAILIFDIERRNNAR